MSAQDDLTALRIATGIVSKRGDDTTAKALARHIGDLSVELALGGRDETATMPGKRLHRIEAGR
ncbi:hypothetical protein A5722_14770 [Mycobacterium vulneris]|nr:hypothetical protein A5722_14770 [Mycolicibacterium vulneris]OCB66192.1 hypothetical protein A5729_12275 [Mycolicibacterium vulneris]